MTTPLFISRLDLAAFLFLAFAMGAYCGIAAYCEYRRWRAHRDRAWFLRDREFRDTFPPRSTGQHVHNDDRGDAFAE